MSDWESKKTALVLAGGGLTGAVYEIGALRAIDDLLIDRSVNDFDIYVGTSAGALIAASLANGQSPEDLLKSIEGSSAEIKPIQTRHIFGVNYPDLLRWSINLPRKLTSTWLTNLWHIRNMTMFDLLWSLAEVVPAGLYDPLTLERYLRQALLDLSKPNDFRRLNRELYIITTELDSGDRVVFGNNMREDVPISLAVAASCALPLVYKPVRIGDKEYIDGSLRGNASIDIAIEHGAKLIICINPLVPFHTFDSTKTPSTPRKTPYLSEKGIQAVANQTLRITGYASLTYHIKQLRRAHPQVDIILIEPKQTDSQVFFDNIMRYAARLEVARLGFEAATLDLAEDYIYYKQTLARHGVLISRRLVIDEITEIQQSGYDPQVIRRILEARSHTCGRNQRGKPICQLTRALAELELTLGNLESAAS